MPIPDHDEHESSRADTGLLEYIDRRRLHQVRQRRQRILVGTMVALGLLVAVLAVSNMILLNRLNAASEAPPPASMASAPPPAVPEPAAPPASAPAPVASAPAPVASAPAASASQTARAPEPVAPTAGAVTPPPAGPTPPAASTRSVPASDPAVRPPMPTTAADEGDSARRTARWLVQTHGRVEAENRVARVAEFYSGEEGAYWRRVLLNVRQEPER